jgi:hypothetical protein
VGGAPSGGGSGGLAILEAPVVSIAGATAGIATNGGSGGCSQGVGQDGTVSTAPAHSASCAGGVDGDGGTGTTAPRGGQVCTQTFCAQNYDAQGGGGAGGRTRIVTRTGEFTATDSPLLTTAVTNATLVAN